MSNQIPKLQILKIYKQLLRESQKFDSYNYRNYALRRIKDSFKENKGLANALELQKQYKFANENLDIIRRQVIIGHLYSTDKLIIETQKK